MKLQLRRSETLAEALENEMRDVMGTEGKDIHMGRKRPTDMRNNREVKMPGPAPPRVEAEYSARLSAWQRAFMSFKDRECRDDGTQMKSNLSVNQQIALKSLSKKVAKVEVIILQADKGKKFVVVDESTYLDMAHDHLSRDVQSNPGEVAASQRVLSATARALGNILGLGRAQSDHAYARCMDNLGSEAEDVPTLKVFPKVHKELDPRGHPQSRPVVAAASGLTSRAGDCLADLLEPLVTTDTPRVEDKSTEEVLMQLQEAEIRIRELGLTNTMVGSLDAKSLYPSLDHLESAEMVAKYVEESTVEIQGVDWRAAQIFAASNLTVAQIKTERLTGIVPERRRRGGVRPGPTTTELGAKRPDPDKPEEETKGPKRRPQQPGLKTKWAETNPESLTVPQRKRLLAVVCKIAVLNIVRNHHYQFAGMTYRQLVGAPIGLRLTSIIARIVMDTWFKRFLSSLVEAKVEVHAALKYIDDVNLVAGMLSLGSRWRTGKVEYSEEWEVEDREKNKSQELVTMECLRDAADAVLPWIRFTLDLPEFHENGMVPMLDLQVWVQHPMNDIDGLESDLLSWMFFEKPSASKKVLRASSAYTWRSKLVTMAMEVFRRLRNTSRQLTLEAKTDIMNTFTVKMRRSGYGTKTVGGVLESGQAHYYRKLRTDLQGGPPLNARDDKNEMKSRRAKMSGTQNWFNRKRGGASATERKDQNWRLDKDRKDHRREDGRLRQRRQGPRRDEGKEEKDPTGDKSKRGTISTLLVPFTVGGTLQRMVQSAEDSYVDLIGGDRVRVIEKGGDTLLNLLGRNDPWSARRSCTDQGCPSCESRRWLQELKKTAKKSGSTLPKALIQSTSQQCRREGNTYAAQCMECIMDLGRSATYWGESSRSNRQRIKEHCRGPETRPDVISSCGPHSGRTWWDQTKVYIHYKLH